MRRLTLIVAVALSGLIGRAAVADGRAWMGIAVGPVPEPLASHLRLDDAGVMITNVVRDSPADRAGLRRYDVIVRVDDRPVPQDVGRFVDMVRRCRVGQRVELTLYRAGKKRVVGLRLAGRPERPWRYKYEAGPGPMRLLPGPLGLRGKVFRRGPGGWRLEDLDELLRDLRSRPWRLPEPGWLWRGGAGRGECGRFKARVVQEDRTVEIEVDSDGRITVRRTVRDDRGERTSRKSYDDPDELRRDDPEAYRIYRQMTRGWCEGPIWERGRLEWLKPYFGPLFDELQEGIKRYRRLQEQLGEGMERLRERFEKLEEDLRRQFETFGSAAPPAGPRRQGREGLKFYVMPDGQILAFRQRGGDVVTRIFRDEEDLRDRAPQLYERFRRVQR